MAPVQFWSTPGLYVKWAARNKPAIFWSIVVGSVGPVMALVVPPIRARFGDGPRPQIPLTYPSESFCSPRSCQAPSANLWMNSAYCSIARRTSRLTHHSQYPRALATLLPATKTKPVAIFSYIHPSNNAPNPSRYIYIRSGYDIILCAVTKPFP